MGDSYLETAGVIFFSILSIIVLIALIEAKETRRSLRLIGIFAIVTMLAFTALDYFLDISQSFWLIPWYGYSAEFHHRKTIHNLSAARREIQSPQFRIPSRP